MKSKNRIVATLSFLLYGMLFSTATAQPYQTVGPPLAPPAWPGTWTPSMAVWDNVGTRPSIGLHQYSGSNLLGISQWGLTSSAGTFSSFSNQNSLGRADVVLNAADAVDLIITNLSIVPTQETYTGAIRFGTTPAGSSGTGPQDIERMTLLNNGNVGIGTKTPSNKLDVEGDLRLSGNQDRSILTGRDGRLNFYSNTDASNSRAWIEMWGPDQQRAGELGLAGTYISFKINSNATSAGETGMLLRPYGDLELFKGNLMFKDAGPTNGRSIITGNSNGRINIYQNTSTTNSYSYIELRGVDDPPYTRTGEVTIGSKYISFLVGASDINPGTEGLWINSDPNFFASGDPCIGIGTKNPQRRIHIADDLPFILFEDNGQDSTTGEGMYVRGGTGHWLEFGWSWDVTNHTGNTKFIFDSSGNAFKPGGGSWSTLSDRKTKKDICEFTDGLDLIKRINPIRYKYLEEYVYSQQEHIGVIAQEMQSIAPYSVASIGICKPGIPGKDGSNSVHVLTFDPSSLIYIAINAIKELDRKDAELEQKQASYDELANQLKSQQEEIRQLREAIEQLRVIPDALRPEIGQSSP